MPASLYISMFCQFQEEQSVDEPRVGGELTMVYKNALFTIHWNIRTFYGCNTWAPLSLEPGYFLNV